ncbi:AAA family ATPase [Flavobacterium branchiicola]|uniref:AAA family ATPase n=1 Tax=Flavobacterium branchiicola TaxID=1114875 RepID=A0ABV9PH49_9FLAO|nr:AAA family ATPase [Flavobacterium branchiicola]MBS7256020.1 AAA family ATPase [Flavobacterium branchiicola]
MKIKKVNLNEEVTSKLGLQPILMDRLGDVVLIAGKNGSGKSRTLKLIKEEVNNVPNALRQRVTSQIIKRRQDAIIREEKNVIKDFSATTQDERKTIIKNYERDIEDQKDILKKATYFSLYPEKEDNVLVDFVPQTLNLVDSFTITPQQRDGHAKLIYNVGMNHVSLGAISAIEKIQRNFVEASVPDDSNVSEEERKEILLQYEKLKSYIKLFLNTDLKRTKEGYPEIFGKRIGEANLSNGQIILLQFCMALYAQEVNLENVVIFMDEPENHLHPAALIEVLDKIIPHIKNGQLWIATHSINVLAHFDPSCIWYIDEGKISYSGDIPETVLKGLLGNEEEIEKLSHFLSLPAQMGSNKFAYESLFYPEVLITGSKDPQVAQIHEIIKDRATKGEKLKVLDFGIGKGRLLSTIYENERLRNSEITEWLDFYGYDKFEENKKICRKVFEDIYDSSDDRYFNEVTKMLSSHDEKTFDIIVMCNVFHEVDPNEWLNLFNSVTSPFKLLKDDGYLLIVEDQFLAIGEKAHAKGFLVYDELEFKKLFKITAVDNYKSNDYRGDGRLKSHHIPKNCINRIDSSSKKESLEVLLQNSKDKIKDIRRNASPTFKNGKRHGFWSQQLANASLALEELS